MKNELEVKQESGALAALPSMEEFGIQEFSANDIIIPKIQLMQPMSKKVTELAVASFGELRDSMTNERLGSFQEPLEFIPFYMETLWVEYRVNGEDKEFLRIVPVVKNPQDPQYNDNWRYEDKEKGISRDRMMNFYVILARDAEAGAGMPRILSFRRTSLNAGRKLATQMLVINRESKLLPCGTVCKLMVSKKTNDDGTFAVLDVEPVRKATTDEQRVAVRWLGPVKSGQAKRDDRDIVETDTETVIDATNTTEF